MFIKKLKNKKIIRAEYQWSWMKLENRKNGSNFKCYKCKIEKPITEFYKNKTRKNGHQGYCKECHKNYHKSLKKKQEVHEDGN